MVTKQSFPPNFQACKSGFFSFFELGSSLLKYKELLGVSISWNIKAFFWENIRSFFWVSISWSIKHFFKIGLKSPISQNKRSFFMVSVPWNMRNFYRSFHFLKYKKMWNFLILELENSISWNIRKFFQVGFLIFFLSLGIKVHQVAAYYTTLNNKF